MEKCFTGQGFPTTAGEPSRAAWGLAEKGGGEKRDDPVPSGLLLLAQLPYDLVAGPAQGEDHPFQLDRPQSLGQGHAVVDPLLQVFQILAFQPGDGLRSPFRLFAGPAPARAGRAWIAWALLGIRGFPAWRPWNSDQRPQ